MAATSLVCMCHTVANAETDQVLPFTDASWSKLNDCMKIWATLDGCEQRIATNFDGIDRRTAGYHRRCYQKFTDKRRLEQGLKRKEKGCLRQITPTHKVMNLP